MVYPICVRQTLGVEIIVTGAEHVGEHRLRLKFSDGTLQFIDFGPLLHNHPHPQHNKYRRLANFKRFRIEQGNVLWGRDWDMIFPIRLFIAR